MHLSHPDEPTLLQLFETLYRRHRLAGKSAASSKNYRINIRHFSRSLGRESVLSDLTNEAILDAMQWMVDRKANVVTANKLRIHLVSLWTFLAKRGVTTTFPDVRPFPQPKRSPVGWSETQLNRLFSVLQQVPGTICGLPSCEWHVCHHLWLWFTAERLTASLEFRAADLDLDTGWCLIRAETRKGKTRDLRRRLPADVLPRFRRFVGFDPVREKLFPLEVTVQMLFLRYKKILAVAGLPNGRESMYHRMRRSAVSHFTARGGNGTLLADHSSSKTTHESYLDPTIVVEQQAADLLFMPIRSSHGEPPRAA